jgi:transmembrane sensor
MDDEHPNARAPHEPPPDPDAAGDPSWDAVARRLAGEGDPVTEARAIEWLGAHPADAAAIDALDETLARLRFEAPADLDVEGALARVKARRAAEPAATAPAATAPATSAPRPDAARHDTPPRVLTMRRPTRRTVPVGWRVAAGVAVLVGGSLVWQAVRGGPTSAGRTYATMVGARDSVRLADGTRVVLGPASSLEVPAGYGDARRDVRLRGEAFFEVRHDAARPFTVHTAAGSVRDVGTAFVVRDGSDGRVTVAVTEGVVILHPPGAEADTLSAERAGGVVLRAGDRGTLLPGGRAAAARGASGEADVAWTRGRVVFDDAAFPDVAAEVRRWYGIELRGADSAVARALASRHLTAAFGSETPDEVLRVIALALGATVERRGDTAYVRPSPTP